MIINIRPRITAPFGALDFMHKTPHTGLDLAVPEGTPVYAVSDGIVSRLTDFGNTNIGKGVILGTDQDTQVIYGHLSRFAVREGQHVHAGDLLAYSGNTGRSSGAHLHIALKHNGEFLDPASLADAALEPAKGFTKLGPIGELREALDTLNATLHSIGEGLRTVAYWLNPNNLIKELHYVFASGTLDVPLIVGTIIGIGLLMAGASWPKKWLAWGWVVFWICRGVIFR